MGMISIHQNQSDRPFFQSRLCLDPIRGIRPESSACQGKGTEWGALTCETDGDGGGCGMGWGCWKKKCFQWTFTTLMSKRVCEKSACGRGFLCIFTLKTHTKEGWRRGWKALKDTSCNSCLGEKKKKKRKEACDCYYLSFLSHSLDLAKRERGRELRRGSICRLVPSQLLISIYHYSNQLLTFAITSWAFSQATVRQHWDLVIIKPLMWVISFPTKHRLQLLLLCFCVAGVGGGGCWTTKQRSLWVVCVHLWRNAGEYQEDDIHISIYCRWIGR